MEIYQVGRVWQGATGRILTAATGATKGEAVSNLNKRRPT